MLLVSNHLLYLNNKFKTSTLINISHEAVIRINVAWVKDAEELRKYLNIKYDVFVDYPEGRNKPPIPQLSFAHTIDIIKSFKNVKYLAVSNIESGNIAGLYKRSMFNGIKFVPKIETVKGVYNLEEILQESQASHIMLDSEDLFTDCKNTQEYIHLNDEVELICKELKVKVLKLQGVIFSD